MKKSSDKELEECKFWAMRVIDHLGYLDGNIKAIEVLAEDSKNAVRAFTFADADFLRFEMKDLQKKFNNLCTDMERWIEAIDKEKLENGEEETIE